jgi:spore coat protein SA
MASQLAVSARTTFVSQGLGRIVPPKAHGSIATWTFETVRHLSRKRPVLLLEFGETAVVTKRVEHDGATYLYVPTAINRLVNAAYERISSIFRKFWSPERRLLRPQYASAFHNLAFAVQAAWAAREWRSEIIHIHNFSQFVPIMRLFNPSARILLHMNCEWLSQHDSQMIRRRLRSADAILGCSGHIVRKLLAKIPEVEDRCHVVFNGADVEHFVPCAEAVAAMEPEPLRILFVGRLSPEKGVHLLVDAFRIVAMRFPTARLELVGGSGSLPPEYLVALSDDPSVKGLERFYRGDYLAELRSRVPSELVDRVTFHGNRSNRDLVAHYRMATIFVNSSLSDAFPLTVVEAMAAGLPIVASAVGGVPEAVVHNETGLLVPANSAEELAAGISILLSDSALRTRMAAAARERALELFSWRAIATRVDAVHVGDVRCCPDPAVEDNGTPSVRKR